MTELKRKSCCCGATEKNPCACMKKGIMKCSSKAPMCQCYKDLKKEGKHPDDLKKSFRTAWNIMKEDYDSDIEVTTRYEQLPEDSLEGEHKWDCPYCGHEQQEYSSYQSVASPFRFANVADLVCTDCDRSVIVHEGK